MRKLLASFLVGSILLLSRAHFMGFGPRRFKEFGQRHVSDGTSAENVSLWESVAASDNVTTNYFSGAVIVSVYTVHYMPGNSLGDL